ncbi:MAG: DUF4255 domain-containing protein [Desulfuromonadaceae bacterium]|nr:DUF4255 domain-containing protein [Desulfuromonadaceae bacterium]
MADYRAVTAFCDSVIRLLKTSYRPEFFGNNPLDFRVGILEDSKPLTSGVSLSLYRIYPNVTNRIPAGRVNPDGSRQKTRLPVDLHLLLTAWGSPSLQYTIAGWMMRTLEDTPIFTASMLNSIGTEVFRQDEEVEVNIVDLTNDDLFRIWEKLSTEPYQISVPYVARNVRIDSGLQVPGAAAVTERRFGKNNAS